MKKYFVVIDGEKKFVANEIQAENLLIDAFLSGVQGINWEIYKVEDPQETPAKGSWFIVRQEFIKQFCSKFNTKVWIEISYKYITPFFDTIEKANEAFNEMNLKGTKKMDSKIKCSDSINENKWVRYIVQCKTL